jgi:hypothetical protein
MDRPELEKRMTEMLTTDTKGAMKNYAADYARCLWAFAEGLISAPMLQCAADDYAGRVRSYHAAIARR